MEVGSPHCQCKETPQKAPVEFLLDFLYQLPLVSAEQVAVEVPGAGEQPWEASVATERDPVWPAGAGEAQEALGPFRCKFLSEEKQRKTHEAHMVVCRETREDSGISRESGGPSVLTAIEAKPCGLWFSPG